MPLYICSTPIGNLKDITLRTLETLQKVDAILCEDTRVSQKLLTHYNIKKPLMVYNDFQAPRDKILRLLQEGKELALISDAGTPLISDPGYKLLRECLSHGVKVVVEPGPSAVLPALIMSGLPPYPFYFGGFFDEKKYNAVCSLNVTLVFFETAKRLIKTLDLLKDNSRTISIVREITKCYEESRLGSASELIKYYKTHPLKGEIVLLMGPIESMQVDERFMLEELKTLLKSYSVNEASKILAQKYKLSKKDLYQKALKLF